ncbi:O-antigen ligase family protein [Alcaligenaceae bacterium CGII-47]|nr:O-antigen ligase family protein [Alcaligenaceae bacterium CGII-47]
MAAMHPSSTLPRYSAWMSCSIAAFYTLMLAAPSGYSYGGALLLIGSLLVLSRGNHDATSLSIQDKTLCALLLAFFATTLIAVLWHQDSFKHLDQAVRYLLAIPILIALRRTTVRIEWLWGGLVLGLLGAAGIAWWQVHLIGFDRADGFLTSAIPFGGISLSMAVWCLLGAILTGSQRRLGWTALLLIGALAGVYAFIASATRGAMVALPILAILLLIATVRRSHWRVILAVSIALAISITLLLTSTSAPQVAERRYNEALTEWHNYVEKGDATNNVGSRLEAWKAALISIPEKPLLGWSHADYDAQTQHLVDTGRIAPFVTTLSNTHNNFIEVWLHQGALGLLAFLALMVTSFWYFCQRLRAPDLTVRILACCGASLPAAFSMFGLTQVILGRNNGVMFFAVSLAVLWAAMRQAEERA